jgi:hypothetical protein
MVLEAMRPKALVPMEGTMVALLELLLGLVPVHLVVALSSETAVARGPHVHSFLSCSSKFSVQCACAC